MAFYFHIDLNAFFVSCERIKDPSLIGKPIVVGGDSRRSIVSTASYEARKFGIHSAMPIFQAKELCKDLIIVPVDMKYYKKKSNEFFHVIEQYSTQYEIASIDECYIDITEIIPQYHDVIQLAKTIQDHVLKEVGVGCSIGISNNMFLAKMASDLKKPLGITVLNQQNIKYFLWPKDIEEMHGIGKKTAERLRTENILTIKDLANEKNIDIIKRVMGKHGYLYYKRANGFDYRNLDLDNDSFKSIGNSTTLSRDTIDDEVIKDTLLRLSRSVSMRAKNKQVVSDHITITIKYTLTKSVTKNFHMEEATNDEEKIYEYATMLFDQIYNGEPVRLLGVSLNHVINLTDLTKQLSLFNYQLESPKKAEKQENEQIKDLMKSLNLTYTSELLKKK